MKSSPHSPQLEKACAHSNEDPTQPIINLKKNAISQTTKKKHWPTELTGLFIPHISMWIWPFSWKMVLIGRLSDIWTWLLFLLKIYHKTPWEGNWMRPVEERKPAKYSNMRFWGKIMKELESRKSKTGKNPGRFLCLFHGFPLGQYLLNNHPSCKEDVLHIYNGILLSHKKEWNNAIYSNMGGPRDCRTKWSKPDRGRQISWDITYMWSLKKKGTNELIYRTEIDPQT